MDPGKSDGETVRAPGSVGRSRKALSILLSFGERFAVVWTFISSIVGDEWSGLPVSNKEEKNGQRDDRVPWSR